MGLHNAHVVEYLQSARYWHDATLEVDQWATHVNIAPLDAAMLLCRHNPNESNWDSLSSNETGTTSYEEPDFRGKVSMTYTPATLRMLAKRLVDIDNADHRSRTLRDWHQTVRDLGLKYHSWIAGYMEATAAPISPAQTATPTPFDDADPCAVFRAMPNLVASDLNISFVGDISESGLGANNMLEISALGMKKRVPLGSLGLLDRRTGNLNSQGAILVGMAKEKWLKNSATNAKKVQRLRNALRDNLGIKDDPFEPYQKITGWKPRFTLSDNRGAADKRAKDKAEFRQPSIEQTRLLDRYLGSSDDGQRKDAIERRQDFSADDWMQKNGHTFSSDDLNHDN